MGDAEQVLDAEVVEEAAVAPSVAQPSAALVVQQGSTELIHAASPQEQIEQAAAIAKALDGVIRSQGMRTKMGRRRVVKPDGKEVWEDSYHTNVEAWQTLATLLGLAIVPSDPEPIRDDSGNVKLVSYEVVREFYPKGTKGAQIRNGSAPIERVERAIVEGAEGFTCRSVVYKNGSIVGAGSSRCTRLEEAWRSKPDYALEGMAQTRAIGRSMATPGRWIVTLAGYNGTPAEEMPPAAAEEPSAEGPAFGPEADGPLIEKIETALGYMLGTDSRAAEVKRVMGWIYGESGYYPKSALNALGWTAGQMLKMRQGASEEDVARAEKLATEHQQVGERPAPGSIAPPVLTGGSLERDIETLINAGCCCSAPLSGDFNMDCPLKGHGIPSGGDTSVV